jgi:SET domain-containing protein
MDITIENSKIHGRGVFANRDFKKGEVVFKWNPKELSEEELTNLPKEDKKHVITINEIKYLMQSPEKYVNHSCEPNTNVDKLHFCDVAIKDIKKGEEITSDYWEDPYHPKMKCNCGSKKCRGFI